MSKTIAEILAPKPAARPRIYACSIDDQAHAGWLNVGALPPVREAIGSGFDTKTITLS